MRCCASDSGIRSGRTRLVSAGREPEPASTCTRAARDSTVDASNSARTGTWVSRAAPRRDTTCVATSELPPGRRIVVESHPVQVQDVGEHAGHDLLRRCRRGPECLRLELRLRQRLPVQLARGIDRERVECDEQLRNHVRRQRRGQRGLDRVGIEVRARDHVRDELIVLDDDDCSRDLGQGEQCGLDLLELDPQTTQLHWKSVRPRYSRRPSRVRRTRSPVRYIRSPLSENGFATKRSAVRSVRAA